MADTIIYELSTQQEPLSEKFISKKFLTVTDNNNGVYNSTSLVIDCASLSSTNEFLSFREAVLQVPIVITLRDISASPANISANVGNLVTLKSGAHHLFHNMTISFNNSEVVSQVDLSSVPMHFRLLTEESLDDENKLGPTYFIQKDSSSPSSWNYGGNIDLAGTATSRNNDASTNAGFATRLGWVSKTLPAVSTANGLNDVMADNIYQQMGNAYWNTYTAGDKQRVLRAVVEIPVKSLHPIFEEMGLVKGLYMRIRAQINQSYLDFTYKSTPSGTGSHFIDPAVSVPSGGIFPLQINETGGSALTDTKTYRLALGFVRSYDSQVTASSDVLGSVQLTVPSYLFSAQAYAEFESLGEEKMITYDDFYKCTVPILGASSTQTTILSTGINRLKSVLIQPTFTATSNGDLISYQSPYSSVPATCDPYARLSNFNLLLNGSPIYIKDEQYTWESYNQEILGTGLNQSTVMGLGSGLISQEDWVNNYGFVYVDCRRRLQPSFESATSVSIKATNGTKLGLDLQTWLIYEKRLILNVFSGQVKAVM
jgi:hypothetical protein